MCALHKDKPLDSDGKCRECKKNETRRKMKMCALHKDKPLDSDGKCRICRNNK